MSTPKLCINCTHFHPAQGVPLRDGYCFSPSNEKSVVDGEIAPMQAKIARIDKLWCGPDANWFEIRLPDIDPTKPFPRGGWTDG